MSRLREVFPKTEVTINDIWQAQSDTTDWVDLDGVGGQVVNIPFTNLHTAIQNSTTDNPKSLIIHFNATVSLDQVGLGCAGHPGESFSNVKVSALGSGEVARTTFDESANDTKYTSRNYQFGPELCNAIELEFYTPDTITITNITIQKVSKTATRLQGVKPNYTVTDIGATNNDNLRVSVQEYGDTPAVDAFARLRVSDNYTIFDSKQLHDKQPLFWDESLGGVATSTHIPADAATEMAVTASAADFVIRQTKQRFNYQPGKSQLIFMTFAAPQVTGITNRIGIFEGTGVDYLTPNNGIFFECDGTLSWNIAKNGVTTETVIQDDWNVDKLDGTGPSGITLDLSAAQILLIDFEWLGVGRVRVGFVIDGLIYYVHYFNHANDSTFDSVYMSSPNLPLRYSIETDGTNAGSLNHICSSVISEGGIEKTGVLRVADTGLSLITNLVNNTDYALVGIKLKALYKDITVIPERVSIIAATNDDFRWSLQLNPTIAGTFTYSDLANSSVQTANGTVSNNITTPGIIIASGYSRSNGQIDTALNTALKLGSTIAGVQDELVLCVSPFTNNASVAVSLNFRELL